MFIRRVSISCFKSVRDAVLDLNRVNVFIGEPDTGKSNILESLGLLSCLKQVVDGYREGSLGKFVRLSTITDLFFNRDLRCSVRICVDSYCVKLHGSSYRCDLWYNDDLLGYITRRGSIRLYKRKGVVLPEVMFYRYRVRDRFESYGLEYPVPPDIPNLLELLQYSSCLREVVGEILSSYGYDVVLKPSDGVIEVQKRIDGNIVVSYPYNLLSDSISRLVFHITPIVLLNGAAIVYEEPETHMFPYYVKYLAEQIALDQKNQYIISTHNPLFLVSILEKTKASDVNIYVVEKIHGETKTWPIDKETYSDILELGEETYFNLDRLVKKITIKQ